MSGVRVPPCSLQVDQLFEAFRKLCRFSIDQLSARQRDCFAVVIVIAQNLIAGNRDDQGAELARAHRQAPCSSGIPEQDNPDRALIGQGRWGGRWCGQPAKHRSSDRVWVWGMSPSSTDSPAGGSDNGPILKPITAGWSGRRLERSLGLRTSLDAVPWPGCRPGPPRTRPTPRPRPRCPPRRPTSGCGARRPGAWCRCSSQSP